MLIGGRFDSPNNANNASLVFEAMVPLADRTRFNNFIKKNQYLFIKKFKNRRKNLHQRENFYYKMRSIHVLKIYDKIRYGFHLSTLQQHHAIPPLKGKSSS